jgi:hypothetical protein
MEYLQDYSYMYLYNNKGKKNFYMSMPYSVQIISLKN